ncbi:fluoride efflux transporter FluC [Nocardioides bruguierae]|uniref:Fluoride-specific ion channel FluC n=1 Tax=Nocardioides bruguierae TaxID=2945102 RepID=A0A9X2IG60_9ACTN|nr:CrcB family protein [Nocardioides bruguierae]MCL8023870.1 CrcB family protein [Nocardioides bruguierae]MCM0621683.1 CrcB family protein [Nocardioides bruguierae]
MPDVLLVALGAAAGAPLRYWLGQVFDRPGLHRGTLVANLVASTLLGLFTGLALSGTVTALLGTGFCGALSTYSSFAVQTHSHPTSPRDGAGIVRGATYALVTLVPALALCSLGFVAGTALA